MNPKVVDQRLNSTTYNRNFQLEFAVTLTTSLCTMLPMEKKSLGERIREIREAKDSPNMSQSDLGRSLGIKPQAVQKWEAGGSEPRQKRWPSIAQALGVTIQQMLRGTIYESSAGTLNASLLESTEVHPGVTTTYKPLAFRNERQSNIPYSETKIPLISWELANKWGAEMGPPYEGFVEEWITLPFDAGERSFVVRIDGESNFDPGAQKSYAPGDFVVVDPARAPTNRCMVVVHMPNESRAIFKQLLMDGDERLLKSLNPSWPNSIVPFPSGARIVGVAHAKWVLE